MDGWRAGERTDGQMDVGFEQMDYSIFVQITWLYTQITKITINMKTKLNLRKQSIQYSQGQHKNDQ